MAIEIATAHGPDPGFVDSILVVAYLEQSRKTLHSNCTKQMLSPLAT